MNVTLPSPEEKRVETAGAAEAGVELVDVEAEAGVVEDVGSQEQIVSALGVAAPEQTRKRLSIKIVLVILYQWISIKSCIF